ncbi:hypothetical protein AgCh_032797 [Apium graveolens]
MDLTWRDVESDCLMDLEINVKYEWTILIRVAKKWIQTNPPAEENGEHLIIIDESHTRMHVWINVNVLPQLAGFFILGKNYKIHNFSIQKSIGKFQCFDSDKHIVLIPTTVTPLPDSWGLIPGQIYGFTNLKRIPNIEDHETYLIDMIGVLKNKSPIVHSIKNEEDKYRLKFDLFDDGHCVNVTLFDKFVVEVDNALGKATSKDVIVIVTCARVTRYDVKCQIATRRINNNATRRMINKATRRMIMYPTDNQFKHRLTVTTQSHASSVCKRNVEAYSTGFLRTKKHCHFHAIMKIFKDAGIE